MKEVGQHANCSVIVIAIDASKIQGPGIIVLPVRLLWVVMPTPRSVSYC